jgi:hypothetical protein
MEAIPSNTLPDKVLDWAGNPVPRGSAYGGRPENQPVGHPHRDKLRANLAKAREVMRRKRLELKAKGITSYKGTHIKSAKPS